MIKVDKGVPAPKHVNGRSRGRPPKEKVLMRVSTTRISNRQYNLLKEFVHKPRMSVDFAQQWDQRAFRSFLIRDWVGYTIERGFHLTEKGFEAWKSFEKTDVHRMNMAAPLTRYFDPKAYGLSAAS